MIGCSRRLLRLTSKRDREIGRGLLRHTWEKPPWKQAITGKAGTHWKTQRWSLWLGRSRNRIEAIVPNQLMRLPADSTELEQTMELMTDDFGGIRFRVTEPSRHEIQTRDLERDFGGGLVFECRWTANRCPSPALPWRKKRPPASSRRHRLTQALMRWSDLPCNSRRSSTRHER